MKERLKTIIHRRDLLRFAVASAGAATAGTLGLDPAVAKPVDRSNKRRDDGADPRLACALPFPGLLDHSQGFTGCGAVAFKPAFCELEQEGLGRRDTARRPAFADGHHLA